jgi:uncharacterized protein
MNQTVTFITLGVSDLERSRRFYADALGWSPTFDLPGTITFFQVAPGVLLGIWPIDELAHDSGAPMTAGSAAMALAQNFDSDAAVDAAYQRAVAAGADPLKPPQRHPEIGIYHAYVADPDGHRWELAHNPGWSVDADGTVHLV